MKEAKNFKQVFLDEYGDSPKLEQDLQTLENVMEDTIQCPF